jgi:hypothetical protein
LRLRPLWRPPLLIPRTTAPGGAPSLARLVLATPVRAIVPRRFRAWQTQERLARRLLTASTSASTPSSTASTHRRLRPWWLPLRATVLTAPPRAPAASCVAPYPRQP